MRLRICEMVYQCMPNKTESITVILEPLMQYLGSVDLEDLPRDFFQNIHWYNAVFKDNAKELDRHEVVEDIYSRRVKAALIKLKYGKDKYLGTLETVTSKQDISEIVRMCELNFQEMDGRDITLSKKQLIWNTYRCFF